MKARFENNKIKLYGQLPKYYKNYAGNFDKQSTDVHESEGFFDVIRPEIDYEFQSLGELYFDEVNSQFTYAVIDKTDAELAAEVEARLSALDEEFNITIIKRLLQRVIAPVLADEANITEQDIADAIMLYPYYRVGKNYEAKERFQYEGQLFEVIQSHTSQADWIPTEVPALYKKFTPPGVIADWKQPAGAHDAYKKGDRVRFNGKVYESLIDANVWSPEVYPAGWKII